MIQRSLQAHPRVLVVDDDVEVAHALGRQLTYVGYDVEIVTGSAVVLERIRAARADWDVVLLDIELPEISGIEILRRFRGSGALASVVMLTGDASATTATTCLRAGAFHYLTKPCLPVELAAVVASAAQHASRRRLMATARNAGTTATLIGGSPAMRRLQAKIDRVAAGDVPVLIEGESGTGKELVARALHDGGAPGRPFLALNCSAIPETLIDSELFGHARGAFTGADRERDGVFVEADGGTLFLDEIGDMPLHVQARLLRVLQDGEVRAVGGDKIRAVDVRVIAATHVNLRAAVADGRFREDLFYRLDVVALHVPALRERPEDLAPLAAHFLGKHGGAPPPTLTADALDVLSAHDWPGNVRELENAIAHAIALAPDPGQPIDVAALPTYLATRAPGPAFDGDRFLPLGEAKRRVHAQFERGYLVHLLERAAGSLSVAARLAGIDRTNLRRLLKRHAIATELFRRGSS